MERKRIKIAAVQRRNAGIWHESFNPEGCARVYVDGAAIMSYLAPEGTITSMADCFDHDLIATVDITDPTNASRLSSLDDGTDNGDTYKITGTMVSKVSGRPDGLYADEINERDVEDLRMSAHKRNYDELREEFARKAVAGEIRGKELGNVTVSCKLNDRSVSGWDRSIYYNHNTNGINTVSIHSGSLVDRRNQTIYKKIEPFKSNIIINGNSYVITNTDSNVIEFMVAQTGVSESSVGEYIKENITGTNKFDIMVTIDNNSVSNNNMTQVDIIGDPRNLNQRIKFDITEDTVVDISRNDYVLCTTDDQTGGTAGHYYRYIAQDPITNVHTSDNSEGDANATDGHFDLSQDDAWLDLGTDGALGGYPTTWLEHGVDGTPLLVTESGESMLPVVGLNAENVKDDFTATDILGVSTDSESYRMYFKASRKGMGVEKFLVRAKDGHWVTFTSGNWRSALEYHRSSAKRPDSHILFNIGSDDTLDALGYSSMEEALDLMLVKVYYKTKSNFLELANSNTLLKLGTGWAGNAYWTVHGSILNSCLINKVPVGTATSVPGTVGQWFKVENWVVNTSPESYMRLENRGWAVKPTHQPVIFAQNNNIPAAKTLNYLTTSNNRARLQFVFKELKYDTDSSNWGDDNKFQITDKVSTLTDENGNTVLYGQKSFDLPYFIK